MQTIICVVYLGMEKHQLLKRAYDNYPKGTEFISTWSGDKYISTGVFTFSDDYQDIYCVGLEEEPLIYDRELKLWAEIIPEKQPSILDGKVAIQVNNEREFKLLMEHYENKGWNASNGNSVKNIQQLNIDSGLKNRLWKYGQGFHAINTGIIAYKQLTFADFASEIGITPPVFIMKSEDGVNLYDEDDFYIAANYSGKWRLLYWDGNKPFKCRVSTLNAEVCTTPEVEKAFSTKEAAEKWIEEQNKPKEIEVRLFTGGYASICKSDIEVYQNDSKIHMKPSDIEEINHVLNSL